MAEEGEDDDLPRIHTGQVFVVNVEQGHVYVRCPDSELHKDVFVSRSVVDPGVLNVGDTVAFALHLSQTGMPHASPPLWRLQGFVKRGTEPELGEFTGTLRMLDHGGSAWVECPEAHEAYGQDVFVHKNVVGQCSLTVGDTIAFNLHVSSNGQPQVSAPVWKDWTILTGTGDKVGGGEKRLQATKNVRVARPPPNSTRELGSLAVGWVCKRDAGRGFVMIRVPNSGYDRDVYVPRTVASTNALSDGDTCFVIILENNRGQPQGAPPVWKLAGRAPPGEPGSIGSYMGRVKEVRENGSAFVDCDLVKAEYSRDAYIRPMVMSELGVKPGDIIAFDVHVNSQGFPQVSSPCWVNCSDELWTGIGRTANSAARNGAAGGKGVWTTEGPVDSNGPPRSEEPGPKRSRLD